MFRFSLLVLLICCSQVYMGIIEFFSALTHHQRFSCITRLGVVFSFLSYIHKYIYIYTQKANLRLSHVCGFFEFKPPTFLRSVPVLYLFVFDCPSLSVHPLYFFFQKKKEGETLLLILSYTKELSKSIKLSLFWGQGKMYLDCYG